MNIKAFTALKQRVKRNNLLRRDLVKRYWIDNSDDENMSPRQIDEAPVQMKDEFFPVTICQKHQFLNLTDFGHTFVYDVLEPNKDHFQLNNRSQVEVKYQQSETQKKKVRILDLVDKEPFTNVKN